MYLVLFSACLSTGVALSLEFMSFLLHFASVAQAALVWDLDYTLPGICYGFPGRISASTEFRQGNGFGMMMLTHSITGAGGERRRK